MTGICIPTSADIRIEVAGRRVAVVQSYRVEEEASCEVVGAIGSNEPVGVVRGPARYRITLQRVYATDEAISDGLRFHELRRFSLVIAKPDTMVVFLSALGEEEQQLAGFGVGADDYLTKPIKMKLLVSRVQAILKRIDAGKAPAPAEEGVAMDRERYTVTRDGREISLPRKEFALLDLLYSSPGKLFSREEIYARIWGSEVVVGDRTIDVHIRKLRQKIGDEKIVTVKGVGYKYEP